MTRLPLAGPSSSFPGFRRRSDRLQPKKGSVADPGLSLVGARQGSDHDTAGFRLPPRIDDWATAVADNVDSTFPGFRIDGLAHVPRRRSEAREHV